MVAMDVEAAFEAVVVVVRVPPHLSFALLVVISVALLSGSGFAGVLLISLGAIFLVLLAHEGFHHLEHLLLFNGVGHGCICAN